MADTPLATRRSWRALPLLALVVVAGAVAGCGGGRSALQRFDDAVAAIANATGTSSDDVANGFRSSLRGASDDVLADSAEALAPRTTWIDDAVRTARPAGDALDSPSLRTMTGASCDTLDFRDEHGRWPMGSEFVSIIAGNLLDQGLDAEWSNVEAAASDVIEHLESLDAGGPDPERLFADVVCFSLG